MLGTRRDLMEVNGEWGCRGDSYAAREAIIPI